ncbi:AraC family transcriptional activator of pobA [Oceanisphaera litoralis]|uniref:helix-turn-helix domain-containing protein n=1 Tax=Oceanisphaera litoralis TaxID=225144 RepID=UPI00195C9582|nr:helix-turn-helix domain-containing protein [Oceanisphaera litoralis]MBM7456618.1 AraC family transcriptional activator of pobA [Oceanisphaera litoralis]
MGGEIPIFKLYGELGHWLTPDLLHYESIAQRSSLHDWEIKPHRHSDLYQLLYVQQGQAELYIEGETRVVEGGVLQWVSPLCVHGFRFSRDVRGAVLTLATPLVSRFEQAMNMPLAFGSASLSLPIAEDKAFLDFVFSSLAREYGHHGTGRELALESWITLLLTWLQRRSIELDTFSELRSKGHVYFARFSGLVERHYHEQWSVQKYAANLGISVVRLNCLCQQLGKQTALQFIHQRLLLEAKRNLIYTSMTIARVSDSLGFSEPAYFSRFFRRLTGRSPNEFRQAGVGQLSGKVDKAES